MEDLIRKEQEIADERKRIIDELDELKNDEKVKRFFELTNKNELLLLEHKKAIKNIKKSEYDSCQHLWVYTRIDDDCIEGRTERYCGCIKCGLNQVVFAKAEYAYGIPDFTFEEEIMYEYMNGSYYMTGLSLPILCDFDLACAIYTKIKENHPDIDDETAGKYLNYALYKMRRKNTSQEKKENRAKRLSLKPKFYNWTEWDIEHTSTH